MLKICVKTTGEIKEVSRNEAFDLIDRKLADLVRQEPPRQTPQGYTDRQFRSRHHR